MDKQTRKETEMLAKLMREQGKNVALSVDDIPEELGTYGVYDGLQVHGGGVTKNMRASVAGLPYLERLRRPLFTWKADDNGNLALHLDGKYRCHMCKEIVNIDDEDDHRFDVHDIEYPEADE